MLYDIQMNMVKQVEKRKEENSYIQMNIVKQEERKREYGKTNKKEKTRLYYIRMNILK